MITKENLRNLGYALFAILLYSVIQDIFIEGLNILSVSETWMDNNSSMIDSISCGILLIIYYLWFKKINTKELIKDNDFKIWKVIIIGFGISGVALLWLNFADAFLSNIGLFKESFQSYDETWSSVGQESYFWQFLSVVFIGVIVEELLFRGIVFNYLERIRGGYFPIVISGIFFGVWHGELIQVVYCILLGIIIATVYAKTRDLRITIAIHMINNFISTLPPIINTETVNYIFNIIVVIMIIPMLVIVFKNKKSCEK